MALLAAWILFPLVLALLACGCGLLVQNVSGDRLPPGLLLPSGLALMIVAADLTTASARTAPITIPLVIALAVAGFGLAFPWRPGRGDLWLSAAALAVIAVYAAPVVLSGQATFAGYIKLDDTATFLAFTDRVMQHGRSLAGLAPSSYQATLAANIPSGYPLGAFFPLGIGGHLVGVDLAWLYQPCIAFFAAMLVFPFGSLLAPLVRLHRLRALAAFIAAQAALLYGYALWGGVKELAAAFLIASAAALAPIAREELGSIRRLVPFALACAALLATLNVSAGLWLLPLGLPAIVVALRHRAKRLLLTIVAGIGLIAVLSLPTLIIARSFLRSVPTGPQELGNLVRPLSLLQLFGLWPSGDFRFWPHQHAATELLVAAAAAAAALSLLVALRRRCWRLPLLVFAVVAVALLIERTSSPWLAGKVYADASPVLVLAALALVAMLIERGFRIEALLLGALIVGGVLWSNVLAYHDVWLAPRAQLHELEWIGNRYAGQGPALMTEYQPYGVRHFLRRLDAEGASELRARPVLLNNGTMLGKAEFADLDRFAISSLLVYRTIVLHTSPVESRPPAPYSLVWQGRYYEVWQRPDPSAPQVLEHLGLGDALHAAAVPACADILRLGTVAARAGGRLVAVPRANGVLLPLARTEHPAGWSSDSTGQMVVPTSAGVLTGSIAVPVSGRYTVWVGGSFVRTVTISIDGRRVGSLGNMLTETSQWTPFGSLRLVPGGHTVTLRYGGSELVPGTGAGPFALGPLALSPTQPGENLVSVSPTDARSLCDESLDWVEAVGP
ncbi:MAG: hypothetical protein ABSC51_02685 [Gaiellaceae bacterium]|jgi:hypothetical protein